MGDMLIVSGASIYTLGLVSVFCFLWGSFVFFKKSDETHLDQTTIFDIIVLSAFWGFIVGRIGFVIANMEIFYKHWTRIFLLTNFPGINRWGILLGFILGIFIMVKKKKGKYLDYFDLAALGYFSGVSFFLLGLSIISFSWENVVLAVLNFGFFLLFWKLEKSYRLISWYRASKSFAKSGFVSGFSLVAIGTLYLIERAMSRLFGTIDLLSIILIISGLVLVYTRSGRILTEDIKSLKIWKKKDRK
jgi:hypothetical protein